MELRSPNWAGENLPPAANGHHSRAPSSITTPAARAPIVTRVRPSSPGLRMLTSPRPMAVGAAPGAAAGPPSSYSFHFPSVLSTSFAYPKIDIHRRMDMSVSRRAMDSNGNSESFGMMDATAARNGVRRHHHTRELAPAGATAASATAVPPPPHSPLPVDAAGNFSISIAAASFSPLEDGVMFAFDSPSSSAMQGSPTKHAVVVAAAAAAAPITAIGTATCSSSSCGDRAVPSFNKLCPNLSPPPLPAAAISTAAPRAAVEAVLPMIMTAPPPSPAHSPLHSPIARRPRHEKVFLQAFTVGQHISISQQQQQQQDHHPPNWSSSRSDCNHEFQNEAHTAATAAAFLDSTSSNNNNTWLDALVDVKRRRLLNSPSPQPSSTSFSRRHDTNNNATSTSNIDNCNISSKIMYTGQHHAQSQPHPRQQQAKYSLPPSASHRSDHDALSRSFDCLALEDCYRSTCAHHKAGRSSTSTSSTSTSTSSSSGTSFTAAMPNVQERGKVERRRKEELKIFVGKEGKEEEDDWADEEEIVGLLERNEAELQEAGLIKSLCASQR